MQALKDTLPVTSSPPRTTGHAPPSSAPSSGLTLAADPEGRKVLAVELYRRFHAMKTYGKEPESLDSIVSVFASDLAGFPADAILRAIRAHAQRSAEFPTVADIAGLIRRNGRPPLSESQFVAVSRKDGADRTPEDWQFLRDWRAEHEGWGDAPDGHRQAADREENARLRQEVRGLRDENARLAGELRQSRVSKGIERPRPGEQERIDATAAAMRAGGAPQGDIDEFLAQYGQRGLGA